ncbi:low affinity iron permease family protein [Pyxidicoccus sp. MSG2]|uniref:low affinity iron permease family protein n=1 Tax=Pyxidicoccus sp. MSG2 TaxID=2996790 RepID=UPI00226E749F|nr:low affinity iron permease family protein [Pyxidicoccus sp. MSG2]MCY1020055.1 low affinity iron permease family protein [Pyxidicoccus sp. MSG2]
MSERFNRFAHAVAEHVGTPRAFVAALVVVLGWALTGPLFHFSDAWQLVINTSTTIITFLMVFIIQATQNRDAKALHLKVDELIRVQAHARAVFEDLEDASDEELAELASQFSRVRLGAKKRRHVAASKDELKGTPSPRETTHTDES